jgi:hypothetical protein
MQIKTSSPKYFDLRTIASINKIVPLLEIICFSNNWVSPDQALA